MSIDIKTPISEVELEDEHDFIAFAQIIGLKVGTSAIRANMVAFTVQLLTSLSEELTSEDFDKIGQKAKTLFNNKLKEEKGKDANKKKSKAPKINADRGGPRNLSNPGYDMYEVEGMEGTEQYGGYDEVDFM
jgi:Translation initiation factor eIF3 subunit